jgi:predicted cobalt transporter CbtA
MIIGNMLWMNPLAMNISARYEDHPATKSMDYFGGTSHWIMLNTLFGVGLMALFVALYVLFYPRLPGSNTWQKGLFFGLLLGLIKAVPEAFNQWMLFDYPVAMIGLQLVNSLLSLAIFGIALALILKRFKALELQNTA